MFFALETRHLTSNLSKNLTSFLVTKLHRNDACGKKNNIGISFPPTFLGMKGGVCDWRVEGGVVVNKKALLLITVIVSAVKFLKITCW